MHRARADEAHHGGRLVAGLDFERIEINGATVEAWRRPRLETPDRQIQFAQTRAQSLRRRIAGAARFVMIESDMNQAAEERARGEHHGVTLEPDAELRDHAGDASTRAVAVEGEIIDGLLEKRQIRRVLEARSDRLLVEDAIRLRPRCTHRRPLARVERPELDSGFIGGERHRAAEGVDLLDEMTLADPADRRIARHLPQRFDAVSKKQCPAPHARRGERGLRSGMAAAHDNYVKAVREEHDLIEH